MSYFATLSLFCALIVAYTASPAVDPIASCTISSYDEVSTVVKACTNIIVSSLDVPAGKTLELDLQAGSTLTFQGITKFEHSNWAGPLLKIKGSKITVTGASGHALDGQGALYWDGKGGSGTKKPKFFRIQATGGSVFKDLMIKNCPIQCVSIGNSDHLTISGFNIDVKAGDTNALGHNTDGFDVSSSTNILVENSNIYNQDDCVAVNQGSNMVFSKLYCSGGHGLSLSVGMSTTSSSANTVSNITFTGCTVTNSDNGIHVKTHTDATTGSIKSVTYHDIQLSGIRKYGVNIQQDYSGGSSTGTPTGNIPITGLTLSSVTGTMTGTSSMPVYILCGSGGCSSWSWSSVSITGGHKADSCNFTPSGFTC